MIELIEQIIELLNQIPSNIAVIFLGLIIVYVLRRQEGINKENDRKFKSGVSNFQMIDGHFLKVSEHFNKIHDQIEGITTKFDERMDLMEKMILKDIIYNDSMDPHERQEAYDRYVSIGGNGMTKQYYETHLLPLVKKHLQKEDLE